MEETAVYMIQGRFTIYHNYGENLQLLEYSKIKDKLLQIELMSSDFGVEKDINKIGLTLIYTALEKVISAIVKKGNV